MKVPSLAIGKENAAVSVSHHLGREIPLDQVLKILAEGKSDLMKGFISQRTKRPFDAYLVFNAKTGKIGFEFPPRERKYPAKNAAGKTEGKAEKTGRTAAKTAGKGAGKR
ncbi:MAG: topoisomerase C-terminal repeat-containing protein [Akkermansia sp.]